VRISYSKQRNAIDNEKYQVTLLYESIKRVRLFLCSSVPDLKIEDITYQGTVSPRGM